MTHVYMYMYMHMFTYIIYIYICIMYIYMHPHRKGHVKTTRCQLRNYQHPPGGWSQRLRSGSTAELSASWPPNSDGATAAAGGWPAADVCNVGQTHGNWENHGTAADVDGEMTKRSCVRSGVFFFCNMLFWFFYQCQIKSPETVFHPLLGRLQAAHGPEEKYGEVVDIWQLQFWESCLPPKKHDWLD